jgi:hypothetical protein
MDRLRLEILIPPTPLRRGSRILEVPLSKGDLGGLMQDLKFHLRQCLLAFPIGFEGKSGNQDSQNRQYRRWDKGVGVTTKDIFGTPSNQSTS